MKNSFFRGAWRSLTGLITKKTPRQRFRLKRSYWKLYLAVLVLAVAIPIGLVMMQNAEEAEAGWFDQGWGFRKKIPIANSGSAQTDFQVQITLDTTALVSAGKLQSDCDDIRFTDIKGKVLSYWLEPSTCNNANTKVWVKVPSIPTSGADVYFYYGNASASSQSSVALTFIREITGVVGSWTLDEPSGNVSDSSGNNYTGTVTGTTSVSGMFGNARSFNGSPSNIVTNLTTAFTDFSVVAWFKDDGNSNGYERIADKAFASCFWLGRNNNIANSWGGGVRENSAPYGIFITLQDTQWHQIATIRSGTTHYIYGNGASVSNSNTVTDLACSTSPFSIGHHPSTPSQNMTGIIDEVRIYDRALSTSELADLYGTGGDRHGYTTANYPGKELVRKYSSSVSLGTVADEEVGTKPVVEFRFDEGQGQVVNDSSGSNLSGTIGVNSSVAADDPTWISEEQCVSGKCLKFDGVDDVVVSQNISARTRTLTAWAKRMGDGSGTWNPVVYKGSGPSGTNYELRILQHGMGQIGIGVNTAAGERLNGSVYAFPTDEWMFLAVTYDDHDIVLYVDGNEVFRSNYNSPMIQNSNWPLKVGGASPYFNGYIDEVKAYSYVRTAAQIKADYNSSSTKFGAHNNTLISDGLIGYWKMDEASWNGTAGEVKDSSGRGRHGRSYGGALLAGGKFANAGSFGGGTSYVDIGDHPEYDFGSNDFSISVWAYRNSGWQQWDTAVAAKWNTGSAPSSNEWTLGFGGTVNGIDTYPGLTLMSGSTAYRAISSDTTSNDQWYHLVGMREGDYVKIYVNGVLKDEEFIGDLAVNNVTGRTLKIARIDAGYGLFGRIDDLRIYNRALSQQEISNLYSYSPPPLAYWKFDEGSGTTAADSSGNGKNGTLTNGATWDVGKIGKAVKLNYDSDLNQTVSIPSLTHNYAFTKMAWIKPVTITGCDSLRCSIIAPYFELSGSNLEYYDDSLSSKGWHTVGGILLNTWQHVTVSYDGFSTLRMYLNGKEVKNVSVTNTGAHSSSVIGGFNATTRNFRGLIDEVKIYDYERSASQIIEDMGGELALGMLGAKLPTPILHYKFDEGGGTTAFDSGSNKDNGDLLDFATSGNYVPGKMNTALSFDGLNDRVQSIISDPVEYKGNDFTYSAWINRKSTDTNASNLLSKPWNGGGQYNYKIFFSGEANSLNVSLSGSTSWTTVTPVATTDNVWTHIAVVIKGSDKSVNIYFDGELVKSDTYTITDWTPPSGDSNASLVIGSLYPYGSGWAGSTDFSFQGLMDEVKIYNAALTADQIKQDMNAGSIMSFGSSAEPEASLLSDGAGAPPVLEWKFDEKQGTTAKDSSGNGRDGNFTNATWGLGKIGSAVQFNAANTSYVESVSDPGAMSSGTYSLWVKPSTLNANMGWIDSTFDIFQWTGSGLYFRAGNQTTASIANLTPNEWYHVALVWNGTNYFGYINGKIVTTGNQTGTRTGNITVGRVDGGHYFTGSIDDVKVYNYARTPAQIAYDYNRGAPVAHWKMDECQGSTINDSSGNNASGLLVIGGGGTQSIGTCYTASTAWGNGKNGKFGSAMAFDGGDDYLSMGDVHDMGTADLTLSAWIKTTETTDFAGIAGKSYYGNKIGRYGIHIRAIGKAGIITERTGGNIQIDSTTTVNNNQWHHVLAVFDRDVGIHLYVNGVREASNLTTFAADNFNTTDPFMIGHYNGHPSGYFNGLIDDVRVYNYALSEDQAKQVMNEGSAIRFGADN